MSGADATFAGRIVALGHELPLPSGGRTPQRLRMLRAAAAADPGFGRLVEAHADALAILAEASRDDLASNRWFGVWAARGATPVVLDRRGDGWRLTGEAPWCSGAGLVDAALVAADHDGATAIVAVPLDAAGVTLAPPDWQSPAFPDMDTRTVTFDVDLPGDALVGDDGWYLGRPGFWHGAVGVAACWAGAAAGLVERVRPIWRDEPHALAHLGAVDAALWQLAALLDAAGAEIDASPADGAAAHRLALRVRHVVDVTVADITDRVQRALGPTPLVRVPGLHRLVAECDLFRRQCHAERDLEVLGRLSG
ncbi:MAG: hypothetical protein QM733_20905 [Ilumatobacteraceae bacterium]